MKTAIIVVHGVCPTPRYQIQDEFATQFAKRLNEAKAKEAPKWNTSVMWPPIAKSDAEPGDVHATALRLWQERDNPDEPREDAYDVFEGYWSPIDKNQTSVASVLQWIASSLFGPLNASSKLYASLGKTAFDLGYVGAILLIVGVFVLLAIQQATSGYDVFANASTLAKCAPLIDTSKYEVCRSAVPSLLDVLLHPTTTLPGVGLKALVYLLATFVGAFALTQLVVSLFNEISEWLRRESIARQMRIRRSDGSGERLSSDALFGGHRAWRFWFQSILLAIALVGLWYVPFYRPFVGDSSHVLAFATVQMVTFVSLLRAAMALLSGFFVNFLGDVQIYTTQDENAKFYQMRKEIVDTVEAVILQVLRSKSGPANTVEVRRQPYSFIKEPEPKVPPLYDRVFIAAHSLGSTISVDALLNIHELYAEKGLDKSDWERLRGIFTFGTSVEKTKFFFDVRKPTVSFSPDHWRDDVYGQLFSDDVNVLEDANNAGGIYWANYWYFNDIVANEVDSYRSTRIAGRTQVATPTTRTKERSVCTNARLSSTFLRPPWHLWVHSDYLSDDNFWKSGHDHENRPYLGVLPLLEKRQRADK